MAGRFENARRAGGGGPGPFAKKETGFRSLCGAVRRKTAAAAGTAVNLVYPRRCPVCDRPVAPAGALVCPACEPMLQRVLAPVCRRCGKPLRAGASASPSLCRDCCRMPHAYDRGGAVFTYRSAAGGLFRFKYGGRREYSAYYGRAMARKLAEDYPAGTFDFLVPVPLSAKRLQKRGYNQALLLAREISGRTGIPVREDLLRREEDTRPMKNMGPLERQNNLKKAFHVYGNDVELSTILLIDDIYTTGATIDACAKALYRQGARRVCFLTLAIGEDLPGAADSEYAKTD